MKNPKEYYVVAEKNKNLLNMRLAGSFILEDTSPIIDKIHTEVVKLKPGFDVINDVRDLNKLDTKTANEIKKGTKILEERGAKRLIRIVGSSKFVVQIFTKFSNFSKSKMKVYYVKTLDEALKIIQEK